MRLFDSRSGQGSSYISEVLKNIISQIFIGYSLFSCRGSYFNRPLIIFSIHRQVHSMEAEAGGNCYHSEPERLSHYRNSVAFLDEEVEALLVKRRQSKT